MSYQQEMNTLKEELLVGLRKLVEHATKEVGLEVLRHAQKDLGTPAPVRVRRETLVKNIEVSTAGTRRDQLLRYFKQLPNTVITFNELKMALKVNRNQIVNPLRQLVVDGLINEQHTVNGRRYVLAVQPAAGSRQQPRRRIMRAHEQPEVQKLASLAKRWGGELVPTHPHDWDAVTRKYKDFTNAPFTQRDLGISFRARTICYDPEDVYWPELVHEFGHVFAAGQPPKDTDEGDWLGWQFALARYIKADVDVLREDNHDFFVGWESEAPYYPEWRGELEVFTLKEQRAIIRHAVRVSKDLGIVTERGRPLPNFKRLRKP